MTQSVMTRRILLIDDDPEFVEHTRQTVVDLAAFRAASSAADAIRTNLLWRPDLIILDVMLGNTESFSLLDAIRAVRGDDRFGVICLARGRGARNQYRRFGNEVFGVMLRDPNRAHYRKHIVKALALVAERDRRVA